MFASVSAKELRVTFITRPRSLLFVTTPNLFQVRNSVHRLLIMSATRKIKLKEYFMAGDALLLVFLLHTLCSIMPQTVMKTMM